MSSFRITRPASEDLQDIHDYLAPRNPHAAGRLVQRLLRTFHSLAEVPGKGHLREDLTDRDYRFWSVDQYMIVYRSEGDLVYIVRVVHGSRDLGTLLEDMRED